MEGLDLLRAMRALRPPGCKVDVITAPDGRVETVARAVSIRLSALELAWLDAVADLRGETRSAVMREAVTWLAARESELLRRRRRYRLIAALASAEQTNPVDDFVAAAQLERVSRRHPPGP